jgi:hypothetical protein
LIVYWAFTKQSRKNKGKRKNQALSCCEAAGYAVGEAGYFNEAAG